MLQFSKYFYISANNVYHIVRSLCFHLWASNHKSNKQQDRIHSKSPKGGIWNGMSKLAVLRIMLKMNADLESRFKALLHYKISYEIFVAEPKIARTLDIYPISSSVTYSQKYFGEKNRSYQAQNKCNMKGTAIYRRRKAINRRNY